MAKGRSEAAGRVGRAAAAGEYRRPDLAVQVGYCGAERRRNRLVGGGPGGEPGAGMTGTPGSEGGSGKRVRRKAGTAPRADPATPTVRTGRLGWSRRIQPSDWRSPAWTSRAESTDAISSVVSCMSTDKLHERIYAPCARHVRLRLARLRTGRVISARRVRELAEALLEDLSAPERDAVLCRTAARTYRLAVTTVGSRRAAPPPSSRLTRSRGRPGSTARAGRSRSRRGGPAHARWRPRRRRGARRTGRCLARCGR